MKETDLIGKCGFYCGSCPTHRTGGCSGCLTAHSRGDCFTIDCTQDRGVEYCGRCERFPCDELLSKEKATVLDPRWLIWKRRERGK